MGAERGQKHLKEDGHSVTWQAWSVFAANSVKMLLIGHLTVLTDAVILDIILTATQGVFLLIYVYMNSIKSMLQSRVTQNYDRHGLWSFAVPLSGMKNLPFFAPCWGTYVCDLEANYVSLDKENYVSLIKYTKKIELGNPAILEGHCGLYFREVNIFSYLTVVFK